MTLDELRAEANHFNPILAKLLNDYFQTVGNDGLTDYVQALVDNYMANVCRLGRSPNKDVHA